MTDKYHDGDILKEVIANSNPNTYKQNAKTMTDKVQKIREEVERLKSQLLRGACSSQIAMETRCKEEAYNEVLAILDSMQEEHKKCMYSKDDFTDEDRKVLCDGCEEECKYSKSDDFTKALAECINQAQCNVVDPMVLAETWKDELIKLAKSEEPVSEDLESEIQRYNNSLNLDAEENYEWDDIASNVILAARHFAKWQKAKDESTTEDLGEYINELSKQFPEVSFAKLSRIAVRVAKWQKQKDKSKVLTEKQSRKICNDAFELGKDAMKQQMMKDAVDATVHFDAGGYPYIPQMELYDYDKDESLAKEGDRVKVVVIKEG